MLTHSHRIRLSNRVQLLHLTKVENGRADRPWRTLEQVHLVPTPNKVTGLQSFGLTVSDFVIVVALHKHLILVIELGRHIRRLVHNLLNITVPRGDRSGMQLR